MYIAVDYYIVEASGTSKIKWACMSRRACLASLFSLSLACHNLLVDYRSTRVDIIFRLSYR